jgi:hypothetical protein
MSFKDALAIMEVSDAGFLIGDLFEVSFGAPFPRPRDDCGLPIPTPPENWHQFVALYRWPDGRFEAVGFCNWIRYGTVYLEGGLCVRTGFYRRIPDNHFQECSGAGGVAQLMMEAGADKLSDCEAWFGFCGDKKAYRVGIRVGYRRLESPGLIVKWFKNVPEARQKDLEAMVAKIGPF